MKTNNCFYLCILSTRVSSTVLPTQGVGATLVKGRPTLSLSGSQGQFSHLAQPMKGTEGLLSFTHATTWQMGGWYQIYHTYVLGPAHLLPPPSIGVSSVLRRQGTLLSAASRERPGQFSGPPQVTRGDREGHLSLTVACM